MIVPINYITKNIKEVIEFHPKKNKKIKKKVVCTIYFHNYFLKL